MPLDLLPREEPRLVAGPLIAYSAGAPQHGPVERQDAAALEELQSHGTVNQRICLASSSNSDSNSDGQRDGHPYVRDLGSPSRPASKGACGHDRGHSSGAGAAETT